MESVYLNKRCQLADDPCDKIGVSTGSSHLLPHDTLDDGLNSLDNLTDGSSLSCSCKRKCQNNEIVLRNISTPQDKCQLR